MNLSQKILSRQKKERKNKRKEKILQKNNLQVNKEEVLIKTFQKYLLKQNNLNLKRKENLKFKKKAQSNLQKNQYKGNNLKSKQLFIMMLRIKVNLIKLIQLQFVLKRYLAQTKNSE